MLDDPARRAEAAKSIVRKSLPPRRPKDYDGRDNPALDSHADKLLPFDRVALLVPVTDAVKTRAMLMWLKDTAIPHVLNEMALESTNTSKCRVVYTALHHWSKHVFKGWRKE
jgi:hypothetical protein